ncbi:MAG: DUF3810 domain-containing protein [Flavobacteriales bacterium]|nr:DUF3810 domain-containing protein [Flavobacteriales bacterium]
MKKKHIIFLFFLLIFMMQWASSYPEFIEKWYSNGIYPFISQLSRTILGWIPFSVGDIIYLSLGIFMVYNLYYWIKHYRRLKRQQLYNAFLFLGTIYLLFYSLWGFNYARISVSQKLTINHQYTPEELISFTRKLIDKTNTIHLQITQDKDLKVTVPFDQNTVFNTTHNGYQTLSKQFDFLTFEQPSIKTSLLSLPLTYMGFSGYLNPFTNEAQVNSMIPMYNFPTTSCHEMAHQIGIGSESECNLIGHLASVKNNNIYFQYSGYTYGLRYCLSDVYDLDPQKFEELLAELNPGIWENFEETHHFQTAYESPIETVSKLIYGNYLKVNKQKDGMKTYNNFVGLMINYYQRYDQSSQLF